MISHSNRAEISIEYYEIDSIMRVTALSPSRKPSQMFVTRICNWNDKKMNADDPSDHDGVAIVAHQSEAT